MTFQPPPPPPPAPPPPPGGGYGPPPSSGGGGGFDPKSVNQFDWGILAAGLLAFIFSFVSYYSYSVKGYAQFGTGHWSAWHGFFGWFAMLLAVAGSAVVALSIFAPQVKLPIPARLACLGAYAIATLSVILALFVVPSPASGAFDSALNKGHGVGYWLSLIVIIAGLVLSLMRAQQTGTKLPGPLNNLPKIG